MTGETVDLLRSESQAIRRGAAAYEQAIRLDPNYADAYYNR